MLFITWDFIEIAANSLPFFNQFKANYTPFMYRVNLYEIHALNCNHFTVLKLMCFLASVSEFIVLAFDCIVLALDTIVVAM